MKMEGDRDNKDKKDNHSDHSNGFVQTLMKRGLIGFSILDVMPPPAWNQLCATSPLPSFIVLHSPQTLLQQTANNPASFI